MNTNWSLKEIYNEENDFNIDLAKLEKHIEKITKWTELELKSNDNIKEKLEQYINLQNELEPLLNIGWYANLAISVDSTNEKLIKLGDKYEDIMTNITKSKVVFQMYVRDIVNLDEIISSSEILKEHEFFLKQLQETAKYLLSENEEILLSKLQNTGSSAWTKLSEQLTSSLMIEIEVNGEKKEEPLSMIRNYAYEEDAKLRKDAYEAELSAYPRIETSMAACLNGIKGEVITNAKMRGFSSPLEMTLLNADLDKDVFEVFMEVLKSSFPVFQKFYKKKAELLGHKNSLPFYDLFAPVGEISMTFTYDEAAEFIIKHFTEFYKPLGDYAKMAFEKNWIDAYPRKGKRGGAFCENLHSIGESRILSNFTGSFSDMVTLAHELGHGYHGLCLKDEAFLNSDYSMPIAETASTFCETIVTKAAIKTASKEEQLVILENDITGMSQVIVDIYSRFLFEDEVFARRKEGSLTPSELKDIMKNAQKATYGKALDENIMHPYMWLPKPHYYDATYNYYNYPYAYGLLFAKGLYAKHLEFEQKGENFMPMYDKILSITGKNSLKNVGTFANIDLSKKEFWQKSIKLIEADIDLFVSL